MRVLPLVLALTVAGCVSAPPQRATPVPPPPVVSLPVPAPLASDWRDWPLTPGTWTYRRDTRGSLALFGRPGSDAALTLRCDIAARRLYLSRAGAVATPVTIRTSSTARTLAVQPTGSVPPYVATAFAPADPLLDAMAFSRGRFTVEQAGAPPLVLPAWAEVGRVTQDCR